MPLKTEIIDYHVEVLPPKSYLSQIDDIKINCEHMIREIRRHVDNSGCELVVEKQNVCDYCGSLWSEDNNIYNGGCCYRDIENFESLGYNYEKYNGDINECR